MCFRNDNRRYAKVAEKFNVSNRHRKRHLTADPGKEFKNRGKTCYPVGFTLVRFSSITKMHLSICLCLNYGLQLALEDRMGRQHCKYGYRSGFV